MDKSIETPVRNQVDRFMQRTPLRRSRNSSSFEPPNHDDDTERTKRRSMVHLQKKIAAGPNTSNSPSMESSLTAGPDEIKDHIDVCLKMFFENKINSKNAWNIKIIDYMGKYLQLGRGNRDSLQLGSASLDVGAKVYSIRVDDVHSAGLKLASDMLKAAHNEPKDQQNESGGEGGEEENANKKKGPLKKKKKFVLGAPKHTIAKDRNTLLSDVPKLDSAFFQTSTNSDLSMVDNFLTTRIAMDKFGCAFTLMSKVKLWTSPEDSDVTLVDKQYPFKKLEVSTISLCPEFQVFKVDEWDPDNDDIPRGNNETTHNTEVMFDDRGIPIAELDGSIHDIFDAPDPLDSDDEQPMEEIAVLGEVANIQDLRPTTLSEADDYSFRPILPSGKCITNIWAGPSHWKFKYLQRAGSRFSGAVAKQTAQKRKPKEKENVMIDFNLTVPLPDENSSKNKIKPLKPWPETNKFRIPINTTTLLQQIQSMFLKPSIKLYEKSFREMNNNGDGDENDTDDLAAYPYDNPSDSFYCTQNEGNDNADDIVNEEEFPAAGQNQAYTGDNLIELPEMVETNFINYATRSKKMDMKKLKEKVWAIMVDKPKENVPSEELYEKKVEKPVSFRSVYKDLPTILNKSMKEELSSPLAFIALLHLANEQNLKLTGRPDMKDFTIEQDPGDPA